MIDDGYVRRSAASDRRFFGALLRSVLELPVARWHPGVLEAVTWIEPVDVHRALTAALLLSLPSAELSLTRSGADDVVALRVREGLARVQRALNIVADQERSHREMVESQMPPEDRELWVEARERATREVLAKLGGLRVAEARVLLGCLLLAWADELRWHEPPWWETAL